MPEIRDPSAPPEPGPAPRGSGFQGHGAGGEGPSLFAVAWRWKFAIVGAALAVGVAAAAVLLQATPLYTARGEVLLQADDASPVALPEAQRAREPTVAAIQNAVILMESGDLLRRVAEDLNLVERPEFNPALREEGVVEEAVDTLRGWVRSLGPDRSAGAAGSVPAREGGDAPAPDPLAPVVSELAGAVRVAPVGASLIVEIRATSSDPQVAADIVNTLARAYIDKRLQSGLAAGREATAWLEERADSLREDLLDAERAVEAFRKDQVEAGAAPTEDLLREAEQIRTEILRRETELADARARKREIEILLEDENFIAATEIITSPVITDLHRRLTEIDSNTYQMRAQFGPDYAGLENLRNTRAEVKGRLRAELRNVLGGLRVNIRVLEDRLGDLQTDLSDVRNAMIERRVQELQLRELEREVAASQEIYNQFLVRLKEARQRSLFQSPDARIASLASPPLYPSAPEKAKLTLIAMVLGGAAMTGIALLLNATRATIKSEDDAWGATGLPVIGNVPVIPGGRRYHAVYRWFRSRPFSVQAEAVRWLRMSLTAGSGDGPEVIMVTSVMSGEGKSTLSLLLATMMVEAGDRTVLIDGDYRRARLSRAIENTRRGAIPLPDGLEFVPVPYAVRPGRRGLGRTVQDSAERIRALIDERGDTCDRIVIDTPAALSVSDVAEIGKLADKSIVVCEWDATPTGALSRCVALLKSNGVRLNGVVLNKVNLREQAREAFPGGARTLRRTMSYYSSEAQTAVQRLRPDMRRSS